MASVVFFFVFLKAMGPFYQCFHPRFDNFSNGIQCEKGWILCEILSENVNSKFLAVHMAISVNLDISKTLFWYLFSGILWPSF